MTFASSVQLAMYVILKVACVIDIVLVAVAKVRMFRLMIVVAIAVQCSMDCRIWEMTVRTTMVHLCHGAVHELVYLNSFGGYDVLLLP